MKAKKKEDGGANSSGSKGEKIEMRKRKQEKQANRKLSILYTTLRSPSKFKFNFMLKPR